MKVKVHFKHVNTNFDKDRYEWFDGEEPDNLKYHFTQSFELQNVKTKTFQNSVKLQIHAKLEDESLITELVEGVSTLECLMMDGSIERFFASNNLIRNNHETYDSKSNTARFYFYLKDDVEFGKINDVTLISTSAFSAEFMALSKNDLWTEYESNAKLIGMSGTISKRGRD